MRGDWLNFVRGLQGGKLLSTNLSVCLTYCSGSAIWDVAVGAAGLE